MNKAKTRVTRDYLALLARRRMWAIVPFVALFSFFILVSLIFPKIYLSETMIMIEPREVPNDFVKDLTGVSVDQRLVAIEQSILSRTNLLQITGEFQDRLPTYTRLSDNRKVDRLKKRIQIEMAPQRSRLPITSFRISYRDTNPELAQQITARLASLFVEKDIRSRESKASRATEFFSAELKEVSEQLRQSQEDLKSLKERYRYELPSELDVNLRTLDRLQLQKTSNGEALDRHLSTKMTLQKQISDTPPLIPREPVSAAARAPETNPLIESYLAKDREYRDLLAKATGSHPDVQRLAKELEQLKEKIPPEDLEAAENPQPVRKDPEMVPNPAYQSLTAQLAQLNTEIEIREKERKWIDAEMERYTRRVQNTPRVEQRLNAALRVNADLTRQHEELKTKLEQAKLAESLETKQSGAQFTIVDPANYPRESISPSRSTLIFLGFLASLLFSLALAWVVEALSQRIWTQRELEDWTKVQVLVEIPKMISAADLVHARRTRMVQAAMLVVIGGAYFGGLYELYRNPSIVIHNLDPVIEQIIERSAD